MDVTFLTFSTVAVSARPHTSSQIPSFIKDGQNIGRPSGPARHDGLWFQAEKVGVNCERVRFSELDDPVCQCCFALCQVRRR